MARKDTVPTTVVEAPADSRLEHLLAQFDAAKEAADEAAEELEKRKKDYEVIRDAIENEAHAMAPAAQRIEIKSRFLKLPLIQNWTSYLKLDDVRLRAEKPELFEAYRTKQVAFWSLKRKA